MHYKYWKAEIGRMFVSCDSTLRHSFTIIMTNINKSKCFERAEKILKSSLVCVKSKSKVSYSFFMVIKSYLIHILHNKISIGYIAFFVQT